MHLKLTASVQITEDYALNADRLLQIKGFLVAPPHERSYLSGHCLWCTYGCLPFVCLLWLLTQTQNFENFIEFQPPPPTITTKNQITPDLASGHSKTKI